MWFIIVDRPYSRFHNDDHRDRVLIVRNVFEFKTPINVLGRFP